MEQQFPLASVDVKCSNEQPEQTQQQVFNFKREDLLEQIEIQNLKINLRIYCSKYPESKRQSPSPAIINLNESLKVLSTLDIAPESSLTIHLVSFLGTIDSEMVSELRTSLSAIKNVNQLIILESTSATTRNPYSFCLFLFFEQYFTFNYLKLSYLSADNEGYQVGVTLFIQTPILFKEYLFANEKIAQNLEIFQLFNRVLAIYSEFNTCRRPFTLHQTDSIEDTNVESTSSSVSSSTGMLNQKLHINLQIGYLEGYIKRAYRIINVMLNLIEFDEARIIKFDLKVLRHKREWSLAHLQQPSIEIDSVRELEELAKLPILKHISLIIQDSRFEWIDSDLFSIAKFMNSVSISVHKYTPISQLNELIDRIQHDISQSKLSYFNLTSLKVQISNRDQIQSIIGIAKALPSIERFYLKGIFPKEFVDYYALLELSAPLFNHLKEFHITSIFGFIEQLSLFLIELPLKKEDYSNFTKRILPTITRFPRPINLLFKIPYVMSQAENKFEILYQTSRSILDLPNVCSFSFLYLNDKFLGIDKEEEIKLINLLQIFLERNSIRISIFAFDFFIRQNMSYNPAAILFDLYEDFAQL